MTTNSEIARVLQELVDLLVMAEGSKQAFRTTESPTWAVPRTPRQTPEAAPT